MNTLFLPARRLLPAALLLLAWSGPAAAQSPLRVGSANPAVAEPPIPRPRTVPVVVPLFRGLEFRDYASHSFPYTPPPGGRKRWAKIILSADYSVTAGRQFDRTGEISVGHACLFLGTTAEPSDGVAQAWHVERDVTDYAALLTTARTGQTQLGNIVNSQYTGIIRGSAALLFYPAAPHEAAPPTPDLVLPLPGGGNGQKALGSGTDTLTETLTLPANITGAYLDLLTQSQGGDEFWYLGVPDALASKLQTGGGTAFREAQITVDGIPAGIAPVLPWIYTGGIDPGWWRPIPAVQTLNFLPYRVNLTPFAGLLSNGRPHTIGVRVVNTTGTR